MEGLCDDGKNWTKRLANGEDLASKKMLELS